MSQYEQMFREESSEQLELAEQALLSYHTFKLYKEVFALEIEKAVEILEIPHITQIHKATSQMQGIVNVRGRVIPLIDTSLKFGLPSIEVGNDTSIIIIDRAEKKIKFGALVDQVQEVVEKEEGGLLPSPSIEANYNLEYFNGVIQDNENYFIVLDIEKNGNLVGELCTASLEHSEGAHQINETIQQLNLVVQQNAASTEELASNSEVLNNQADAFKKSFSFFIMDEEENESYFSTRSNYHSFSGHKNREPVNGKAIYTDRISELNSVFRNSKGYELVLNSALDNLDNDFEKY